MGVCILALKSVSGPAQTSDSTSAGTGPSDAVYIKVVAPAFLGICSTHRQGPSSRDEGFLKC